MPSCLAGWQDKQGCVQLDPGFAHRAPGVPHTFLLSAAQAGFTLLLFPGFLYLFLTRVSNVSIAAKSRSLCSTEQHHMAHHYPGCLVFFTQHVL